MHCRSYSVEKRSAPLLSSDTLDAAHVRQPTVGAYLCHQRGDGGSSISRILDCMHACPIPWFVGLCTQLSGSCAAVHLEAPRLIEGSPVGYRGLLRVSALPPVGDRMVRCSPKLVGLAKHESCQACSGG